MFGFGKPNVKKMENVKDVEGLIKALEYEKDDNVRSDAAWALRNIDDARAVGPLIKTLNDSSWTVRANSASGLGKIGDVRAVEPLTRALYDNYTKVSVNAAWALENIGWKPGKDENAARYWIVKEEWDKCVEIGTPAVEPLIEVLDYYKKDARRQAAEILGKIGDIRAVEPLIKTLNDPCDDVHESAAEALGYIGDARAVQPLVEALNEAISGYSKEIIAKKDAEALGNIGDATSVESLIKAISYSKERYLYVVGAEAAKALIEQALVEALAKIGTHAVEPLIKALDDPDKCVSSYAAKVLGDIGDERAVEPLIKALNDSDLCWGAAEALGKIGDERAVDPLIKTLIGDYNLAGVAKALEMIGWKPGKDEDAARYWIAKKEWGKCVEVGTHAVEPLIKALGSYDWEVRRGAAKTLGEMGDARAVEPLIEALYHTDYFEGMHIAEALGKIGTSAVEPLIKALNGFDTWVCSYASTALGIIGDARAVEPLTKALNRSNDAFSQAEMDLRRQATWALANIGDVRTVEPLLKALGNFDSTVRKIAAEALAKTGDSRAAEPLVRALNDSSWEVRKAAAKSLIYLYKNGAIDQYSKKIIFMQRSVIEMPHVDNSSPSDCSHADSGIGIDFPI